MEVAPHRLSPEVSVVIPTRDRWRLLSRTLVGAFGQEDVELEVIVVDDGSRDETPARLAEIDDPRLRVIRHQRSRGVAAARNAGLAKARGEWLALLDDDDLWSPRKLRAQLDAAAAGSAAWVYCAAVIIDIDDRPLEADIAAPDPDDVLGALMGGALPGGGSNVVARTELVRRLGGFDERARFDDWDLYIRLAAAAPAAACPDVLVGYRRHGGSRVLAEAETLTSDLDYLASKHSALLRERGLAVDRVRFSRWLAWAHRRAGHRRRAAATYFRAGLRHASFGNLVRAAAVLLWEWHPESRRHRSAPSPSWLGRFQ